MDILQHAGNVVAAFAGHTHMVRTPQLRGTAIPSDAQYQSDVQQPLSVLHYLVPVQVFQKAHVPNAFAGVLKLWSLRM